MSDLSFTPVEVAAMSDAELIENAKRVWNCTHIPSSAHKGRLRPVDEFSILIRRKAMKKGLSSSLKKPLTVNARTEENDERNPINRHRYVAMHKALAKGDMAEVEAIQRLRGRDLLEIGIMPNPHTFPVVAAPLEHYLNPDEKVRRVVAAPPVIRRLAAVQAAQRASDERQLAIAAATVLMAEKLKKQDDRIAALEKLIAELST